MHQAAVLFNFHDIFLILTSTLYVVFATLILLLPDKNTRSRYLLAALMLACSIVPIHTLFSYGEYIRPWVMWNDLNLFYVFGIGYWIAPPLLYFYVRCYLIKDLEFRKTDALHVLPAAFYLIYTYVEYLWHGNEYTYYVIKSLTLFPSSHDAANMLLKVLFTLVYIIACWQIIKKHKIPHTNYSSSANSDAKWLLALVSIFFLQSVGLASVLLICSLTPNSNIHSLLGELGIYFKFILVCLLIYYRFRHQPVLQYIEVSVSSKGRKFSESALAEKAMYLKDFMRRHKPYKNPSLSLSQLAIMVKLPTRTLSKIINQYFNVNFFEFINSYRIDEAKCLLSSEDHTDKKIKDISVNAGFRSRSVFYSVFTQAVGKTPAEFRSAHTIHTQENSNTTLTTE